MSGPIQTIPQGLLGLLQLKELGKNPGVLVDSVAPNIDLFQLYAQRLVQSEGGLFGVAQIATTGLVNGNHGFQNLTLVGPSTAAQVPTTEMWYVYQFSLDVQSLAAADTLTAGACIIPQGGRPTMVGPIFADTINARARSWISAPITAPFFAGPGTLFGIYLTDILTGTLIQPFGAIRAVRIPL